MAANRDNPKASGVVPRLSQMVDELGTTESGDMGNKTRRGLTSRIEISCFDFRSKRI